MRLTRRRYLTGAAEARVRPELSPTSQYERVVAEAIASPATAAIMKALVSEVVTATALTAEPRSTRDAIRWRPSTRRS
jgi:hypothetical protein